MAITIQPSNAVHPIAEAIRALNAIKPIAAKRTALIAKRVTAYKAAYEAYRDGSKAHCDAAVKDLLKVGAMFVPSSAVTRTVDRAFADFKRTSAYTDLTKAKRAVTFARKSADATHDQICGAVNLLERHLDDIRFTLEANAAGKTMLFRGEWSSRLMTEAEVALMTAMLTDGTNVLTDLDDLEIAVKASIKTTWGLI
jgi:hypothetical protein